MTSHNQPMPPPIRTNTVDSQKSRSSSGQTSPPYSPSSPTARATASPTEASFFGAISARIRGRSRSRSRGATSRKRSKSPMVMPPEQAPYSQRHASATSPISPTRPTAGPVQGDRPSIQAAGRRSTSGSDPWKGRHSNDWLFNGYSLTASAKELVQRRK
ncbi:uncharacterized protein J4E88_005083 [Alternaria novae-zelandiae]|uniref:uncharacterized protein n=1 Tax=Alternaria ethzedia TaxID=181014 RepID=UPI0020C23549|nr:uncharacterized protein J4E87_000568 [Alternaria ethzedia]XP_049255404.1 uncharacterized protein J4E88_005083 [Alternaria novae-zelandiae]KAI4635615.1 hypothetical protein J4E87_000568 [Alternaria ethzedia]KAI4682194.1 hypothetical protein J4E88_005083 [Alternaria novae-zelandiae]